MACLPIGTCLLAHSLSHNQSISQQLFTNPRTGVVVFLLLIDIHCLTPLYPILDRSLWISGGLEVSAC